MKVHAFIPAAQPDWVQASVYSYYDLVDKIVVSYDRDGLGWNGRPMPVDQTLELLRELDVDGKMVYSPGKYHRSEHVPHENATHQRQCALEEAGDGADWVLMLDTDEVLADPATFRSCLEQAAAEGFEGLHYPARWLYRYLGRDLFMEACSRFWRVAAGFPGPLAVRPGATLKHHRQCDVRMFRVDFGARNTDPARGRNTVVHRGVAPQQGVMHYSYVRRRDHLRRKFANHGRLHNANANREFAQWDWCGRHPVLAMLCAPLPSRLMSSHRSRFRISRIRPCNAYVQRELSLC